MDAKRLPYTGVKSQAFVDDFTGEGYFKALIHMHLHSILWISLFPPDADIARDYDRDGPA